MDDEGRSLRFKITLASAGRRGGDGQSPPQQQQMGNNLIPSSGCSSTGYDASFPGASAQPPMPVYSHHDQCGGAGTYQSNLPPAPMRHQAQHDDLQPSYLHPHHQHQQQQQMPQSFQHIAQAPMGYLLHGPPMDRYALESNLLPGAPPAPQPSGPQRYGGGIVRISELRQQGVNVLLPAMTPGTGKAVRGGGVGGGHGSTPTVSASYEEFEPSAPARRGRGRGGATGGGGGRRARSGRGTAASKIELQADGTLHEYRWYMKGGRRVLVYNGQSIKSTAAHKVWAQIKKAQAGGGGGGGAPASAPSRSRAVTARGRAKPAATRRTATAAASSPRSHLDRPLTLVHGASGGGRSSFLLPAPIDEPSFIDIILSQRNSQQSPVLPPAPPRHTPTKQPVAARTNSSWQSLVSMYPQLAANPPPGGSGSGPAVARGLSALPFQPSGRAQTAATRAGTGQFGTLLAPRPQPQQQQQLSQSTRPAVTQPEQVVEISDSEGEGDGSAADGPSDGEGSESASSQEWQYFGDDGSDTSGSSSASLLSSFSSSEGSGSGKRQGRSARKRRRAEGSRDGGTGHLPDGGFVRRTVDGHDVVEKDGWVYPAELLSMLTQEQATVAPQPAIASVQQPAGPSHRAMPRLPGTSDSGGIVVLGASGQPVNPLARQPTVRPAYPGGSLGPDVGRYGDDNNLLDAVGGEAGMEDMFDRGDELGGFRY